MKYKNIAIVTLTIILFLFFYYFMSKKEISLVLDRIQINVKLANMFSSKTNIITYNKKNHIDILDTLTDHPILFLPNKNTNSIFVLYFFDIEMHVFKIKITESVTDDNKMNLNNSLKRIILSTKGFGIASLTKMELREIIKNIIIMPESDYKYFSVPSIDLGLYKHYLSKQEIIKMLQKGIYQEANIDTTSIQSKLNQ